MYRNIVITLKSEYNLHIEDRKGDTWKDNHQLYTVHIIMRSFNQ